MLDIQKSVNYITPLKRDPRRVIDRLGASLSLLCALHCALQPLLLATLPLLGLGVLLNEELESVFLLLSLVMAFWSLSAGMRHHGQKWLWGLWLLSGSLIAGSRLWENFEMPLAVAGALGIVACHSLNLFFDRHHQHS